MEVGDVLRSAAEILGAVSSDDVEMGHTAIIDLDLGPAATADFVAYTRPVLTQWKLGGTTWLLAERGALERKIAVLKEAGVTIIAGGTGAEIAMTRGTWAAFVALCADLGIDRVEVAEGFLGNVAEPRAVVDVAVARGLDVQYEIGRKDLDEDRHMTVAERLDSALRWADCGVDSFVLEAREVGTGFALFPENGEINRGLLQALLRHFSLSQLVFEAPTRPAFCGVLTEIGPAANLANITPHDLLRVEMMRRAIHADTIHCRERWIAGASAGRGDGR
jgi:phosphosulfolactate synthase